MPRACPICSEQPLVPLAARDVEVDSCPRCQGLWFDRGELELFPDRPSVRQFLAAARQAASRCRRLGHLVPRAEVACATCHSAPVACPACGGRLSLVVTATCTVDVCVPCEGVWLDRGELELLERVPARPRPPTPGAWEIPAAAAPVTDPWSAPGATRALANGHAVRINSHTALECSACSALLTVREAHALDGDVYCGACRPAGAVSGATLPPDVEHAEPCAKRGGGWGSIVAFLLDALR
ncbi:MULTISPECIES: zf-TFIIB domain-containing protein [Myxococcaceae]|uniref:TFIIB-type zinc ribbon-containing protein n=1 Tax=Myxococcaceae TaxID=31 RepID=UPI00188DEF2A|nr:MULTISPECIES: zf-TFIIB domain-containing protein [Myxococcaceae]MBF5040909.1 zf-TFIIB domain-containing protein [Simulacricoccus sp. 17bor-14]